MGTFLRDLKSYSQGGKHKMNDKMSDNMKKNKSGVLRTVAKGVTLAISLAVHTFGMDSNPKKAKEPFSICEKLTSFSDIVEHTNLQNLNLSYSQITIIPDWIQTLTNLQHLNLSHNKIMSIPDWIQTLTNLQHLDLSSNQLKMVPEGVRKLTNLQNLVFSRNRLEIIPDWIDNLMNLQVLGFSYNQLMRIPDGVSNLTNLQMLGCAGNQLMNIPYGIGKLPNLKDLYLFYNPSLGNRSKDFQRVDLVKFQEKLLKERIIFQKYICFSWGMQTTIGFPVDTITVIFRIIFTQAMLEFDEEMCKRQKEHEKRNK
jgi:hypothetical protein